MKKEMKWPHCDYHSICKNKAYAEVYPSLINQKPKKEGWSYLCKKHYYHEQHRLKWKLPTAILKEEDIEEFNKLRKS